MDSERLTPPRPPEAVGTGLDALGDTCEFWGVGGWAPGVPAPGLTEHCPAWTWPSLSEPWGCRGDSLAAQGWQVGPRLPSSGNSLVGLAQGLYNSSSESEAQGNTHTHTHTHAHTHSQQRTHPQPRHLHRTETLWTRPGGGNTGAGRTLSPGRGDGRPGHSLRGRLQHVGGLLVIMEHE